MAEQSLQSVPADTNGLATYDQRTRDIVKRTVFPTANDDELELYLYDCKRQGVHPLDRMIHPQIRTDSKGQRRYIAITSIDLFRARAGSTSEHAGTDATIFFTPEDRPGSFPAEATVTVYRFVKGERCAFTATVRWAEYYPGDGPAGGMWRKMPFNMLSKVCEALALRKAFPAQLGGIYTREEMEQGDESGPINRDPRARALRGVEKAASKDMSEAVEELVDSIASELEVPPVEAEPEMVISDKEFEAACQKAKSVLNWNCLKKPSDGDVTWFVCAPALSALHGHSNGSIKWKDGDVRVMHDKDVAGLYKVLRDAITARVAAV